VTDLPVRIAFCITELDPGGAERALVRIVCGLNRQRWSPHVYCLAHRGPLADELEAAGIPVTCLGARSGADVMVVLRLASVLRRFRPDIVQTFMFHGNMVGRLAAWWARVPVVVAGVRVVEPDARWRMRLDRWTNRLVSHTVCVSHAVADRYHTMGFRHDQSTVVSNGVDVERFAQASAADLREFGIPADAQRVIFVGRLHPQKGWRHLLAAFSQVNREFPEGAKPHLLIAGDGPERALVVSEISRLGLNERVHLAGWQRDVAPLLRAADVFVLSSLWEGMPNVLLEAMAAGLPCVATSVEGVAELIIPGETGRLVAPGDEPALAAEISALLTDREAATRLAAAGQAHVRQRFTWEQTVRGFESVWRRMLDEAAYTAERTLPDHCARK
jgi:glycosyltransferase involved in cell wall biosynthesis